MKAEEILKQEYEKKYKWLRYKGSHKFDNEDVVLSSMKEYAKLKCKEQRGICESIVKQTFIDDIELEGYIKNAPEPNFD